MGLSEAIKKSIDDNFWDNPEPNIQIFHALKTPEEMDYLVGIANWDVCVSTTLKWVAENPLCSKATALRMFWMAQPEEYTKYEFSEKVRGEQELFDLVKIILNNYQNDFYMDSDIHYNPQEQMPKNDETLDFMRQETHGEEWYIYYDKHEINGWYGDELEHRYKRADSVMELFNYAYFCRKPEIAKLILENALCDKGIAVLLFWRLKTYATCYAATNPLLDEIKHKVKANKYQERIAYDPKTDNEIKLFQEHQKKWAIPEVMKQPV